MPRDVDFFAFAHEFPDAVLALAGIRGRGHTATSVAAKEQSRALDLVFRGRGQRAPLIYMEVQDRGDVEVERSALIKLAILCDQLRCWRTAQVVILYATEASLRRARKADVALRGWRSIAFTPLRIDRFRPASAPSWRTSSIASSAGGRVADFTWRRRCSSRSSRV